MNRGTHRARRARGGTIPAATKGFPAVLAVLAVLASCASYPPLTPPGTQLPAGVTLTDSGRLIELLPDAAASEPESATDSGAAATGLVFYPGGLVEPEAYVSLLAPIAAAGHPVVIVRMPLDLAVFGWRRATDVLTEDRGWVIAGHSLGGAMAARFLAREGDSYPTLRGLALTGAYPADDLSESGYHVVSVWASEDGLATPEEREETASLLPPDTHYVVIEGGNHAGFGEYGPQEDDGERTIPLWEQHEQTRAAILELLSALKRDE